MPVTLNGVSGNGKIKPESIFSYSYSEDVTSIDPSSLDGGTSQVSVSAISADNSLLLINNSMQFNDSESGSIQFQVKKVSQAGGAVNITGDTLMARLNVSRTAGPVGGTMEAPASLLTAINYYCSLVSVAPAFDDLLNEDLDLIPVNFIGWTGNVWEHLKMLCSAVSVSLVDNEPIEMYFNNNTLRFRRALTRVADFSGSISDESISIDSFDASKSIGVYNYNTSYGENKVVYEESNYDENADPETTFKSSINDVMQVDAGKTITKRFKIDASLTTVNQPACVSTITRVPPSPYADGGLGEYVVVGNDDLPIQPSEWNALGGKLTVSITENPNEIEITITAPDSKTMPTADDPANEVTNAPYKIGAELDTYPAFWITGTGVFFNKKEKRFLTGSPDSYTASDEAPVVDNPFISTLHSLSNAGIAAAQSYCGPLVTIDKTVGAPGQFGTTIGLTEKVGDRRFRYQSASYSPSSLQLSGRMYTSINEFDENWVDSTFANFDAVTSNLKFSEFTVVPLTKGI